MDLFGDLPVAKNTLDESKSRGASDAELHSASAKGAASSSDVADAAIDNEGLSKKKLRTGDGNVSVTSSFQKTLGTAGTTIAFIPSALRRNPTDTLLAVANAVTQRKINTLDETATNASTTKSSSAKKDQLYLEKNVDNLIQFKSVDCQTQGNAVGFLGATQDVKGRGLPVLREEPDDLRELHESVIDMYDPFFPNDYLEYKTGIRQKEDQRELEIHTKEKLRQQELMRQQIAEERRKLALQFSNAESGGGDSSVPLPIHNRIRGVGRGRGVSNLPSWMVKKQEPSVEPTAKGIVGQRGSSSGAAEAVNKSVVPSSATQHQDSGADGKQSSLENRVLVLYNMVAPGDTDDDLAIEVKEECEAQCGPVLGIMIKDVDSYHAQVRVFVLFERAADAENGRILFSNRSFGGRTVTTSTADESIMD